jgi:hypothetical protein
MDISLRSLSFIVGATKEAVSKSTAYRRAHGERMKDEPGGVGLGLKLEEFAEFGQVGQIGQDVVGVGFPEVFQRMIPVGDGEDSGSHRPSQPNLCPLVIRMLDTVAAGAEGTSLVRDDLLKADRSA